METSKKDAGEVLHEKHKQRLRQKFLEEGSFSGFYDHEILEMLLGYAIVRKNTNEIAHRLIDKFKTLDGVFEAHPEELKKIEGLGERSITLLKMQYELFRVYTSAKYKLKNKKYSSAAVIPYLKAMFLGKQDELVYLICINDKDEIINVKLVGKSGMGNVSLEFRDILKEILMLNASGVVIAHNHPNNILKASEEDIETTRTLIGLLERVSVKLIDHIIVAKDDYISVLERMEKERKK